MTKIAPERPVSSAAPLGDVGRFPILEVAPCVDDGRWPARCAAGEVVPLSATVIREGHDRVGATAVLVDPEGTEHSREPMQRSKPGLDRYHALVCPDRPGAWTFHIEAWDDPVATWVHAAEQKIPLNVDTELMLTEGMAWLRRAAELWPAQAPTRAVLEQACTTLDDETRPAVDRLAAALTDEVRQALVERPVRRLVTTSPAYALQVMRPLAAVSSWYEFFPRSIGARRDPETGRWESGTLRTAEHMLPYVAELGFNVVYTPPLHPIGRTHRKGPNNTLDAGPLDPGSPYAIGSTAGGHEAIHPDLGTLADFRQFVQKAHSLGLEVAMDLALQCSPDHPWVTEHPEWFAHRVDGTIAYAENPPKKYQDIYPLHFDTDPVGLCEAIRDVVVHWIEQGVTLFRVDNPHTKPLFLWEWLLAEIARDYPEVVFLAEAFTRPAVMRALAKVGFHQSYTYFTWRTSAAELKDYLVELSTGSYDTDAGVTGTADYMRPNFWPTTPDILTPEMTEGGLASHRIRALLAGTLSPSWGLYSGYEFVESQPRPGAQEHMNSEKYEYRPRDFVGAMNRGESLAGWLKLVNTIRRDNPAVLQLRQLRFHPTGHDELLAYSHHLPARFSPTGRDNTVITVVNLNPYDMVEGTVSLDLAAIGREQSGADLTVYDTVTGREYRWSQEFFVRLGHNVPAHVAVVQ